MFSSRFVRWLRLDRLGPQPGVTDRALLLAFTARFTDELLVGAWTVLAPTFRQVFRLSLVQIGLLSQVLNWVALVVEPITSTLIDHRCRRWLMAGGAVASAASLLAMGTAPSYFWLMAGFAAYGIGSGPLCLTADVLVVEAFPDAPERAYARSTLVDSAGALLGPADVAAAAFAGVSWRVVVVVLALWAVIYAFAASSTTFTDPPRPVSESRVSKGRWLVREAVSGVRAAIGAPEVRRTLLVLFCFDVFEAAFVLKYLWLHDDVGLSVGGVAVWAAAEQVVDLVALVLLDHWLVNRSPAAVFRVATWALTVLPALWVLAPGVAGRVVVGIPLAFGHTLIWPLAKSDSLTADRDLAGATQAITALFPIVPLALLESTFAQVIGIGPAMAITAAFGAAAMLAVSRPAPN